jgi:alkanesulfonate monooxygenase SsuD/methylene tetrahydromethanopterin reductase-like flavin-dependent oxidoreductase (luciferase family)
MPKPLQDGGVPIWISGTIRDTTVRRLVRFGQRWIPWGKDDGDMTDSLPRMKDALGKAGGDPDALQASGPLPAVWGADRQMDLARTMERVPARVAAGQTDFMVPFGPSPDPAETEARLREIVQAFHSATGRAR